jgi:hypothetical protein
MSDKKQSNSQENKSELATAKEELKDAKQELKDAEDKLATAESKLKDAKQELKDAKQVNDQFDIDTAKQSVKNALSGVKHALSGVTRCEEATKDAQDRVKKLLARARSLPRDTSGKDHSDVSQSNASSATLQAMSFLNKYVMSTGDVTVRGVALQDIIGDTLHTTKSFEEALELSTDEGFSQEPLIDFTTLSNSETTFQNQVLNPFLQKQGIIHTDTSNQSEGERAPAFKIAKSVIVDEVVTNVYTNSGKPDGGHDPRGPITAEIKTKPKGRVLQQALERLYAMKEVNGFLKKAFAFAVSGTTTSTDAYLLTFTRTWDPDQCRFTELTDILPIHHTRVGTKWVELRESCKKPEFFLTDDGMVAIPLLVRAGIQPMFWRIQLCSSSMSSVYTCHRVKRALRDFLFVFWRTSLRTT